MLMTSRGARAPSPGAAARRATLYDHPTTVARLADQARERAASPLAKLVARLAHAFASALAALGLRQRTP